MCMAGPAFYWLIDEGEEKDSVFQKKKTKKGKQGQNRVHKSCRLCFCGLGRLLWDSMLLVGA